MASSFTEDRGRDVVRIVHIKHGKRPTDVTTRLAQGGLWEVLINVRSVARSILSDPAGKNIAPRNANAWECWRGRGSIREGIARRLGKMLKRRNDVSR